MTSQRINVGPSCIVFGSMFRDVEMELCPRIAYTDLSSTKLNLEEVVEKLTSTYLIQLNCFTVHLKHYGLDGPRRALPKELERFRVKTKRFEVQSGITGLRDLIIRAADIYQ